jgi:hypothetical protein
MHKSENWLHFVFSKQGLFPDLERKFIWNYEISRIPNLQEGLNLLSLFSYQTKRGLPEQNVGECFL